jgi:hypothetical protein
MLRRTFTAYFYVRRIYLQYDPHMYGDILFSARVSHILNKNIRLPRRVLCWHCDAR